MNLTQHHTGTEYIQHLKADDFSLQALKLYQYQYANNSIYQRFCQSLGKTPDKVHSLETIPFLPVSFFKSHAITCAKNIPEQWFESSTTTGTVPSRHYIHDISVYEASLLQGFQEFYGNPENYAILGLLPGYLERPNASLVYMVRRLMELSQHAYNDFYLHDFQKLAAHLQTLEKKQQPVLLIGVTFALLDFADRYSLALPNTIMIETGGMKGRKEEITREEVHTILKSRFEGVQVHSEYGMTEMFSQAYAQQNGIFRPSSTLRVLVSDIHDPLDIQITGTGRLMIMDLANRDSCAFLATDDAGTVFTDHSFTVVGRIDYSELRGCSLMVS